MDGNLNPAMSSQPQLDKEKKPQQQPPPPPPSMTNTPNANIPTSSNAGPGPGPGPHSATSGSSVSGAASTSTSTTAAVIGVGEQLGATNSNSVPYKKPNPPLAVPGLPIMNTPTPPATPIGSASASASDSASNTNTNTNTTSTNIDTSSDSKNTTSTGSTSTSTSNVTNNSVTNNNTNTNHSKSDFVAAKKKNQSSSSFSGGGNASAGISGSAGTNKGEGASGSNSSSMPSIKIKSVKAITSLKASEREREGMLKGTMPTSMGNHKSSGKDKNKDKERDRDRDAVSNSTKPKPPPMSLSVSLSMSKHKPDKKKDHLLGGIRPHSQSKPPATTSSSITIGKSGSGSGKKDKLSKSDKKSDKREKDSSIMSMSSQSTSASASASASAKQAKAEKKKRAEKAKKAKLKRKELAKKAAAAAAAAANGGDAGVGAGASMGMGVKMNQDGGEGDESGAGAGAGEVNSSSAKGKPGPKKGKKKKEDKKKKKGKLSPAQAAVKDMMRQLLEEDKYSYKGSIVDDDTSDEEDDERAVYAVSGGTTSGYGGYVHGSSKRHAYAEEEASLIHLDRATIARAARKRLRVEGMRGVMDTTMAASGGRKRANSIVIVEDGADSNALAIAESHSMTSDDGNGGASGGRLGKKKKRKKVKRGVGAVVGNASVGVGVTVGGVARCIPASDPYQPTEDVHATTTDDGSQTTEGTLKDDSDEPMSADESSIFGQTTGSSNATWVECDKCKKWRRLRGIVDAKKLPPKWFCSMNKNDPERSKCAAPEEEYETQNTPETLTDQRARKHFRLWVRRLQCNENYEARMPTMTRGKRRNATSAKDPYEWVRCCNPSCGKWRAVLRSMEASSVIDAAKNGEWYCVLNTWDEKTASCAAPQESLPAIGCPPWVMQNEE